MSEVQDIEISDPEDYSTSQRLKHIYEARRELRQMRREAAQHRHRRPLKALSFYRTAVESYLMELDTLFKTTDRGEYLWHDYDFGTVTIEPPGDFTKRMGYYIDRDYQMPNNKNLKVRSIPDPVTVELKGLKSLFETDSPIEHTFEYEGMSELSGDPAVVLTGRAYVSWRSLNEMVSETNNFVSDLGIGLDLDDTDEWKI